MSQKGHATGLSEGGGAQEEQLQQHIIAADTGGGRPWQRRGLCTGGSSKAALEGGGTRGKLRRPEEKDEGIGRGVQRMQRGEGEVWDDGHGVRRSSWSRAAL